MTFAYALGISSSHWMTQMRLAPVKGRLLVQSYKECLVCSSPQPGQAAVITSIWLIRRLRLREVEQLT